MNVTSAISARLVKLTNGTDRLWLTTPYNHEFARAARDLGGKWQAQSRVWSFDPRDGHRIAQVCRDIYGYDWLSLDASTLKTVRLTLRPDHRKVDQLTTSTELWACGRQVLKRWRRDEAVKLGESVVLLSGGFRQSGGSVRYPAIGLPKDNTVLLIRDVPPAMAEREQDTWGEDLTIESE